MRRLSITECRNCNKIYSFLPTQRLNPFFICYCLTLSRVMGANWFWMIRWKSFRVAISARCRSQFTRNRKYVINIFIFSEYASVIVIHKHIYSTRHSMNELFVFVFCSWINLFGATYAALFGQPSRFLKIIYSKMSPNEHRDCDSCVFSSVSYFLWSMRSSLRISGRKYSVKQNMPNSIRRT